MSEEARALGALRAAAVSAERLAVASLRLLSEAEQSTGSYRSRVYARARATYARRVAALARRAAAGAEDPAALASLFRAALGRAVDAAATTALARAGAVPSTRTYSTIERELEAETARFARFARAARAGEVDYQGGVDARADLYVGHLDGIRNRVWAEASGGPGVLWWWALGDADHCEDCLVLHLESPFEEAAPTVPRAGGTRCLSNCGCELIRTTGGRDPGED